MKNFTLTLLAFLLIQWCTLHKISCTTVTVSQNSSDEDHHSPLSEDNLLKVSATNAVSNSTDHNSYSDSTSAYVNEKKSERNQRTLYRRAGGHLRGDVSSTTTTESTSLPHRRPTVQSHLNEPSTSHEVIHPVNSNSIKNHKSYFRRKTKTTLQPSQHNSSSSHRDENERGSSSNKVINVTILDSSDSKEISDTNDEENSLDYGLMAMSAAGEGNKDDEELTKTSFKDVKKDEKVKTLSDQIAEGKYGLIEKEIFSKTPKAPGIISYKTNSETPGDNEKTLGGLSKDEIWLAEDHLLVLKGGIANDNKNNQNQNWHPIDDYEAPKRPVKIPLNPRVPPPFPVQLTENGPLQFVGHNKFSIFNPFTNETGLFANVNGHISSANQANSDDTKNSVAGLGAVKNLTKDKIHEVIPPPPWLFHNSYKDVDLLKHFPFNLPLPDQALNRTEDFDEDDPSLFYPPPYSFVYKTNYTNLAPVGPLVPGIILPPPPDFFSVYDPEEEKKPIKTPLDAYHRIKDIQLKNRLSATTSAPSTTTEQPPRSSTASYIRDFTRKTKPPSTTFSTTKIYKTKTTTVRPVTIHSSTMSPLTTPNEILNYKTHHYDTTTLRLHPVYIPPSMSTKLYSTVSTTTTTQAPIEPQNVKQYQKDYGTQHHPIYFEYFDARTANPINNGNPYVGPEYDTSYVNGQSTTSSSTMPPPVQPIALFNSPSSKVNKKPKSFYPPQFISTTISPANIDAKYLFVTPKPDIFGTIIAPQKYQISTESPISYNTALPVQKPLVLKPVGKFEDEIAAIKQTLDYYNGGSKHKHTQKPKVKAVYEFSFEASKHKNQHQQPSQEEFQPMLSYDQKNAHLTELIKTNSYYPTSSEPSMKYYRTKQSATLPPKKKNAHMESGVSASPQSMHYGQKLRQQNLNYYARPIFKEVVTSPHQSQQQSQKIIIYPSQSSHDIQSAPMPINVDQHGYRINSKNIKYRNPQQSQQQQQYYGPASEVISLINDTLVNYKSPQRPINPLSEFIDVSRFPQTNPTPQTGLRPQNNPPYIPQHLYPQHLPPHPSQIPHQQPLYPGPFQRPQQNYPQQSQHNFPQQSQHNFQQQSQHNFQQQSHQNYPQQQNYHPSASHPSLDVVNYPLISQINPESVHITFYNRPLEKSDDGKF